jgi:hypothetical protein
VRDAQELDDAVYEIADGGTIRLLDDIDPIKASTCSVT